MNWGIKTKWTKFFIFILLIALLTGCAQSTEPIESDNQVKESIFANLEYNSDDSELAVSIIEELSSPKYLGRLTGSEGNELAVKYIEEKFEELGLGIPKGLDSYRQQFFPKSIATEEKPNLRILDEKGTIIKEFDYMKDFQVRTFWENTRIDGNVKRKVYIPEEGTEISNDNKDIKDKILLVNKDIVSKYGTDGLVSKALTLELPGIIMNLDDKKGEYYIVSLSNRHQGGYDDNGPFALYCTDSVYRELVKAQDSGHEVEITANFSYKEVEANNVIGVIPGTDKKDEYIIVGAHLDHVGDNKNETYNPGALDNASGIGGLIEVAKAIKDSKIPPQKTIIFIAFNGEEEGLHGSKYYVENSPYPLDNSVMINMDMIGSKEEIPLLVAINSSKGKDLKDAFKVLSEEQGIEYQIGVEGRSDHTPFDQKGVPSVLLIHFAQKEYHTPTDTLENSISEERLNQVIKLVLSYIDKNGY